jgi:polar amino acid transport system substrate-binding protein
MRLIQFCRTVLPCIFAALAWAAAARPTAAAPPVIPPSIDVVVYADESYPPYSYAENGELKGIYPAIFAKAFERMPGYHVTIKPVAWKRGLMLLETGTGFALFPPYLRPQERPYMSYSEPVMAEQVSVFCSDRIAAQKRNNWPQDFYGLRIGMNNGFLVGGEAFQQAVKDGKLSMDTSPGSRSSLLKLLLGRIDCYINDRLSILWELERIKAEGLYEEGSKKIIEVAPVRQELAYLGYTERDGGRFSYKADFNRQLNAVLLEMKKKGEIQKIAESILTSE